MKTYADETIESAIIEGLLRRKINVVAAVELGYRGKPDEFHLAMASELEAVILTHDVDFLMMARVTGTKHRGIIFAHAKNVSTGECIRGVELITSVLTDRDMMNHAEFL